MSILAPSLQKELHLDNEALGWLFAVFYYAYTFAQMAVGPILDRSNLRWAFALAVFLWSVVSVLTGLANGFVALLIFRFSLGVVESANWPAGMRVVARLTGTAGAGARQRHLYQRNQRGRVGGTRLDSGHCRVLGVAVGIRADWFARHCLDRSLATLNARSKAGPRLARTDGSGDERAGGPIASLQEYYPKPALSADPRGCNPVNPCIYFCVNWLPTYFAQQRGLSPGRQLGWILTAIYFGLDIGNIVCGSAILALMRWGFRSASPGERFHLGDVGHGVLCRGSSPPDGWGRSRPCARQLRRRHLGHGVSDASSGGIGHPRVDGDRVF